MLPATLRDDVWRQQCARIPLLDSFRAQEIGQLRELSSQLLQRKQFHGAGGLQVDDRMRLLVSIQACLPVLELGLDWYQGWSSFVLYPTEFVAPQSDIDDAGVVHEYERAEIGEAWPGGPVILSWEHVLAGAHGFDDGNVVLHEMAHKLDESNGTVNGMPALHRGMSKAAWSQAFTAAYRDMHRRARAGLPVPFDPYALQAPEEFFAVLSEVFFVDPHPLRTRYPAVYEQLRSFYRQDPWARQMRLDSYPRAQ